MVAHSDDGGVTFSAPSQITPAVNNRHNPGRQGSTIRTDSHGNVYVFFEGATRLPDGTVSSAQMLATSGDGGQSFGRPRPIALVTDVGVFDPVQLDVTFDGFAGARTDSFPSVDIANGAPTGIPNGNPASDRILLGWSDARAGAGHEDALLQTSNDGGNTWSDPRAVQTVGDRPDFTAVAISPDGKTAYAVYDAFSAGPYPDLSQPRPMQGVVISLPGDLSGNATTELYRGPKGDARGSSTNALDSGFLGDYNSAAAGPNAVYAVWNDTRNAADCPAVDTYRTALRNGTTATKPYPQAACPSGFGNTIFGNTGIYGGAYSP
jgi:hypothetical protein